MSGGDPIGAVPADLAGLVGHTFADPDLLQAALTHPSAGGHRTARRAYERLEFLGDRVLALAITEFLLERYPDEPEGELSRRLVSLVRAEAIAGVAETAGLGRFVRTDASAGFGGGKARISILSDACEAVIGALYLDGGLEPARGFVRRHWAGVLNSSHAHRPPDDPKTLLQEWLQGKGHALPQYEVIDRDGPAHAPHFTVEVRADDGRSARAAGPSKRQAEKAAARALLAALEAQP